MTLAGESSASAIHAMYEHLRGGADAGGGLLRNHAVAAAAPAGLATAATVSSPSKPAHRAQAADPPPREHVHFVQRVAGQAANDSSTARARLPSCITEICGFRSASEAPPESHAIDETRPIAAGSDTRLILPQARDALPRYTARK